MNAVVLTRKELPEASLLVDVLTEEGYRIKLKIPGILKSKKRNAFFLAPLTLWDFTLLGSRRDIIIPREYSLITAPFDFHVSYRELSLLADLGVPMKYVRPEICLPDLYFELASAIKAWANPGSRDHILNRFYLRFLDAMGLLHFSSHCSQCQTELGPEDRYLISSGSICADCLKRQSFSAMEILPNAWVEKNFNRSYGAVDREVLPVGSENCQPDRIYRENILKNLQTLL